MNLNSGFFAAYYYRRKQPNKFYHLPLNTQETHHQQRSHSTLSKYTRSYVINKSFDESFLPSIPTSDDTKDGQRPYRRNDFANNPVFVAKHRLAYLFRNQPSVTSQPNNDLIHLFDPHEPKEKNQLRNKFKQQVTFILINKISDICHLLCRIFKKIINYYLNKTEMDIHLLLL